MHWVDDTANSVSSAFPHQADQSVARQRPLSPAHEIDGSMTRPLAFGAALMGQSSTASWATATSCFGFGFGGTQRDQTSPVEHKFSMSIISEDGARPTSPTGHQVASELTSARSILSVPEPPLGSINDSGSTQEMQSPPTVHRGIADEVLSYIAELQASGLGSMLAVELIGYSGVAGALTSGDEYAAEDENYDSRDGAVPKNRYNSDNGVRG